MQQYIVARNDINLNNNLSYTFSAGNFISLEPNFEVGLGTTFETNLTSCSFESFDCNGNDYYAYKDSNFEQKLVEIYPNPASTQAYVMNLKLGDVITITDKFGNLMLRQVCDNEAEDCKIELSNFNTGWHFVLVYRNNELINYEKLLVE